MLLMFEFKILVILYVVLIKFKVMFFLFFGKVVLNFVVVIGMILLLLIVWIIWLINKI